MSKPNGSQTACAVLLACATTAIGLPAQTFTVLQSFNGTNGSVPLSTLVQATDGNLYGTTYSGGVSGNGTVFKITPTGTLTTLYRFCSRSDCADGAYPTAALVQAANGNFYATTDGGGANCDGSLFKIDPSGSLTTLYSFSTRAVAAMIPKRLWFKPPIGTSTGQPCLAGPTAMERCLKSLQVAR